MSHTALAKWKNFNCVFTNNICNIYLLSSKCVIYLFILFVTLSETFIYKVKMLFYATHYDQKLNC